MNTRELIPLVDKVQEALSDLDEWITGYKEGHDKLRDDAVAAADAYLKDIEHSEATITQKISELENQKKEIARKRKEIAGHMAQATVSGDAGLVADIQAQLAELNGNEAAIDQMIAALRISSAPENPDLWADAQKAQDELLQFNEQKREGISRMISYVRDIKQAVEEMELKTKQMEYDLFNPAYKKALERRRSTPQTKPVESDQPTVTVLGPSFRPPEPRAPEPVATDKTPRTVRSIVPAWIAEE